MTNETLTSNAATPNEGATNQQQGEGTTAAAEVTTQTQNDSATTETEGSKTATEGEGVEAKEGEEGKSPDDTKPVAPEKYEFVLPEGIAIDTERMGKFEALAKKLNISQDDAQELVNMGADIAKTSKGQSPEDIVAQARIEWSKQSIADKELGGDALKENLAVAAKARDTFGTPEFKDLLNKSGLGDHPEVIRTFYRIGKAISEDKVIVNTNVGATTPEAAADKLYGKKSN